VGHFLFVAPPFHGHLRPMAALGHALLQRGHRVTFAAVPDARARIDALGHASVEVAATSHPVGFLAAAEERMARSGAMAGLGPVITDMAEMTDRLAAELPSVVEAAGADAIVVDQLEAAGGLVARGLGLPYATVANALPIDRDEGQAPFFTGWGPPQSRWEYQRAEGAERVADWMMRRLGHVIARHAAAFDIGPVRTPADLLSPTVNIGQLTPSLNFGCAPRWRHDVGPLQRSADEGVRTPTKRARPLVYASLGTLFGRRTDLLAAIVAATRDLDIDVVLAHGGHVAADALGPARPGLEITNWVDQRAMLAQASVCITHAGMNTTLDAAAAGVPMVAVPIAFDQPGIAARIAHAGLGVVAPPGLRFPARLKTALGRVLDDLPAYRDKARAAAAEIAATGGAAEGAASIETLVASRDDAPAA
jgi:zeaxanthin glucosyltransferase